MTERFLRWFSAAAACALLGCNPSSSLVTCHRYDAIALTPENNFAAVVETASLKPIEAPPEGIEVSLTAIRPIRGAITLVHVIGAHEAARWNLVIPDSEQTFVHCFISSQGKASSCRATIQVPPHPPGGYYYLETNGNTVLEAGISFRLCERAPAREVTPSKPSGEPSGPENQTEPSAPENPTPPEEGTVE